MKYISPLYANEHISTEDIICDSLFSITHGTTQVKNETTGQMEDVDATIITVQADKIFGF